MFSNISLKLRKIKFSFIPLKEKRLLLVSWYLCPLCQGIQKAGARFILYHWLDTCLYASLLPPWLKGLETWFYFISFFKRENWKFWNMREGDRALQPHGQSPRMWGGGGDYCLLTMVAMWKLVPLVDAEALTNLQNTSWTPAPAHLEPQGQLSLAADRQGLIRLRAFVSPAGGWS